MSDSSCNFYFLLERSHVLNPIKCHSVIANLQGTREIFRRVLERKKRREIFAVDPGYLFLKDI